METVNITSSDFIKVNGVSSESLGIYIDTPPVPPMSQQRITSAKTGLDFDVSTRDDVWDDITINITAFAFFTSSDFDLSSVYAFIANAETLEISRFPGFYFKVRNVRGVSPSNQYNGDKVKFSMQFICKPFKYFTSNDWLQFDGEKIVNPGTRFCRPIYHITGTSSVTLTVNGVNFGVAPLDGSDFYIDCERLVAYLAPGISDDPNILPKTSGQFPFLQPGNNNVGISAGTMEYKLNARCY